MVTQQKQFFKNLKTIFLATHMRNHMPKFESSKLSSVDRIERTNNTNKHTDELK